MKKYPKPIVNYSYIINFFLLILFISFNSSCKKDAKNQPVADKLHQTIDAGISNDEITQWLAANPGVISSNALLYNSQQAVIDNKLVIRVPLAANAALYFTKENNVLKEYVYKWNDRDPGAANYTGTIDVYSFEHKKLNRLVYNKAVLTKVLLPANAATFSKNHDSRLQLVETDEEFKANCLAQGGDITEDDYSITCTTYYDVDYGPIYISGGGGGSSTGPSGGVPGTVTGGGGGGSGSSGGNGGGASWGPAPCPASSSAVASGGVLKVDKVAPTNPGTTPPSTTPSAGCPTVSQWQPKPIIPLNPTYSYLNPSFSYPLNTNFPDLGVINILDVAFDPGKLSTTKLTITNLSTTETFNSYNNTLPADSYPDNHPVSIAVRTFNPYIYAAFLGSNNTSIKNFHQTAKGLSGSDGYGKAIGAIGEGLFAQRLLSIPSVSRVRTISGAVVMDNTNPSKTIYIDLLTEQTLPEAEEGYSYVKMQYTDVNGNALSKDLKIQRNSQTRMMGFTILNKGFVAYEIKTYNPSNTPDILFKGFVEGIQQTMTRGFFRNMTAGVLVFDKAAFTALYNSPYRAKVDAILKSAQAMRNINGEQAVFLRLENNLWLNANSAYYALIAKIKVL
ncbi:hypothetical protein ACFFGT_27565 [Mucilaginibacter angelicae]|uniref:Uncharacterized protein n=1 Tax=Mucilaginibacter angelicae TaxID=869718 RepID=A0ABV6LEW4_9SPHI